MQQSNSSRTHVTYLLRQHHLRLTPQRLAIAEFILNQKMHITARKVHEHMRHDFPSMSLNTIYLTLKQFETCGFIHSFEIDGNIIFDSNTTPHNHAYCHQCNSLIDLKNSDQFTLPPQLTQWDIQSEQRIWLGLCPACIKQTHT